MNIVGRTLKSVKYTGTQLSLALLNVYRVALSPYMPGQCRFEPSCSEYARQSIRQYGVRGLWLALKRLVRCTFWRGLGYDPVPLGAEVRERVKLE